MMSNTIKGVLFDKDGTLLDFNKTWLPPYLKAAKFLATQFNQAEKENELLVLGGYDVSTGSWGLDSLLASGSNGEIIDFWSSILGENIEGAVLSELESIFSFDLEGHVPAIDNMAAYLKSLTETGLQLGIATMDSESNAVELAKHLGFYDSMRFICGFDSGFGLKPDPGMLDAFCQACQLKHNEVVMVGDSPKDLQMGKNAGAALSVGVLTGAHDKEALSEHADIVLDDISELLNAII